MLQQHLLVISTKCLSLPVNIYICVRLLRDVDGIISGGMIPKVECCVEAVMGGINHTVILDGRIPHSILIEMLSDEGIGTLFKK